jgi:hypothetical protein
MNQPDGNSQRDPQEAAEELDWISYLDEVPDREDDEDEEFEEVYGQCSCPYCFCINSTEYGEVCNDCLAGMHQG